MTKEEFKQKYLHGLDGNEAVPFWKIESLLDDLVSQGFGGVQALEADTVGIACIGAGASWVNVTVKTAATDIIHLPGVADVEIGHVVRGVCPATGCEIRVAEADDDTVALNGNHVTVNEAALAAGAMFEARLLTKTAWILFNYSSAGAFSAPTPD
jgi:hypothetical protein